VLLYAATAVRPLQWMESLAVLYGGLMVIEALFYEANVLVFNGYRLAKKGKLQIVLSHRRLVITSLQNYATIIFWFALFYRHWQHLYTVQPSYDGDRILTWLALSFKTMTGFGHVSVEAQTVGAGGLLLAQAAIGVSMALLIVVSFVRLLPKPGTRDYWESSTQNEDERTLLELARVRKDRKMSNEDKSHDAFDMLCWVTSATLAVRLSDAIRRDKPPDRQTQYALAAIVGSLAIGALCLGFAYQLFSSGTVATFHPHVPAVTWTVITACPGGIFLCCGSLLVLAGIVIGVCAATRAAPDSHSESNTNAGEGTSGDSNQDQDSTQHTA
jgi:hypothetical protein